MSRILASADFRRTVAIIAVAAFLLAFAPLVAGPFVLHVLTVSLYYVILAASWNLLAGYTGQFSLAHHVFAAIGAYTSGLLGYHLDAPIWLSIPAGVLLAAIMGCVLGMLVLRMRAIYLAIATWAFAETVHIFLTAAYDFTRGELGLNMKSLFGTLDPQPFYFTFLALTAVSLILMRAVIESPMGFFMRAIKDDELRARSLGIDTTRVKVIVFTLSSAIAGLAGAFNGYYIKVLSPQIADFSEMARLVIMVVIGGLGSFLGPVIGAAPVQIVMTWLQKYGEWNLALFALIVILLMRFSVGGLASHVEGVWRRVTKAT